MGESSDKVTLKDAMQYGEAALDAAQAFLGVEFDDDDEEEEEYGDIFTDMGEYEKATTSHVDDEESYTDEGSGYGDVEEVYNDLTASYTGGDDGHGGLMDKVYNSVMSGVRRMLKPITKRYDNGIKKANKRITKNQRMNSVQDRQIARLTRIVRVQRKMKKRVKKRAQKNALAQGLMSAAQSIPGLKAHAILFGETLRNVRADDVKVSGIWENFAVPATVVEHTPTAPVAGAANDATANAAIDGIEVTLQKLITNQNQLYVEIAKIKTAEETRGADLAKLDALLAPDSTQELIRLIPSQLESQKVALYEGGAKYVGGKEERGILTGILT